MSEFNQIHLFDGADYNPERDGARLSKQLQKIYDLMKEGRWWTLRELEDATNYPQASISASIRNFRKDKFGGHTVEREYVTNGIYKYKLILKRAEA